ncbi:unnamed protein product, partial [Porites lobata]
IRTLKWSDARRTCQMLGGDLAIIKSADEDNFIFTLFKKQKTITDGGVWLGFVRKADNKFYWIDDTPLAKGYTAWARGEPNKVIEKCGNMFGSPHRYGGKWNDIPCDLDPAKHWSCFAKNKPQSDVSDSAMYTSDKPRQPMGQTFNINNWGFGSADRKTLMQIKSKIDSLYEPKSTPTVCPQDGWVRYGNFGYLIINIRTLKWSDARRTCQMLGGDLAIIKSTDENNFVFTLLKKQKTITDWGVWLGFVRKADNKFYWIDDTPLAKGYTAWASRQPDNSGGNEKCGNMFGSIKGVGGKWNDLPCDVTRYWKYAPVILCKKKQIR